MSDYISALSAELQNPNSLYHLPPIDFRARHLHSVFQERKTKKLVYLDLNFWINCRDALNVQESDASLLNAKQTSYVTIYTLLEKLTASGKTWCVVSSSLLDEMSKMTEEKRIQTARIMDRLHCNKTLNNIQIALSELVNVTYAIAGKPLASHYYLTSIFGANPLLSEAFFKRNEDKEDFFRNVLYADTINYTVEDSMKELTITIGDSPSRLADAFNRLKASEAVPRYKNLVIDGLESQIAVTGQRFPSVSSALNSLSVSSQLSVFQTQAPFQYLLASIYAAMAVDKNRKMQTNDYFDTMQSCVAVPYADFLFTEKSFKHLLTTKPIEQLTSYKAVVESDVQIIITLLKNLMM